MIELITCESGDWKVLKLGDEIIHEGHDIPDFAWLNFISKLSNISFSKYCISDEDMENRTFE